MSQLTEKTLPSWLLLVSLSVFGGCSSQKLAPIEITKDHRIERATEELDEWLHDHCKYVGIRQGKDASSKWVNETEVNFLELLDSRSDRFQVIAGFACQQFPPADLIERH